MPKRISGVRVCNTCGQHVRIGESGRVPAHARKGKPCPSAGKLAGSVTLTTKVVEAQKRRARDAAQRAAEYAAGAQKRAELQVIRESESAERELNRARAREEFGSTQSARASSGGLPGLGRR